MEVGENRGKTLWLNKTLRACVSCNSEGLGTSNWSESTDQMACWSRCQQLERSEWVKSHDSSWSWTMAIGAKGLKYKQLGQLRVHKQAYYHLQTSMTSQQAGEVAW